MGVNAKGKPAWLRYGVAVLLVAVATVLRLEFLGILGARAIYITFYPAVILAALFGGLLPGLVAGAMSAMAANYFWQPPIYSLRMTDPADWVGMFIFLGSCVLISWMADATRRADARALEPPVHDKCRRHAGKPEHQSEAIQVKMPDGDIGKHVSSSIDAPFGT